jgi:nitronate monooxygenase
MAFCQQYGLRIPILQAPMAGSCPVNLAVAVADAGGMGAMGETFAAKMDPRRTGRISHAWLNGLSNQKP